MTGRVRGFRRTGAALTLWAVTMGLVIAFGPGAASGQDTAFEAGEGSAIAQGAKVDPKNGQLSFGIKVALSLADHINQRARAESRSIDLGVIGTTMAAEGCDGGDPTYPEEDQPQPVRVTNADKNSEEGKTATEFGFIEKHAEATDAPLGRSVTTAAPFSIPGAVDVGKIRTESTSGVVDSGMREARAISEIESITFAGGQAVLRGLRWEAAVRTGTEDERITSFSIASGEIGGNAIPGIEGDAIEGLTELNAALEPIGFQIAPPQERLAGEVLFLTPMRVSIIPSQARDDVLGRILGGAQPIRERLFEEMIAYDCGNATYVTLADIGIGSVSGAGSLGLELGGVQATSGDLTLSSTLGDIPEFGPPPDLTSPPAVAGTPGTPGIPAQPGTATDSGIDTTSEDEIDEAISEPTPADASDEQASGPVEQAAASPIANRIGTRGGAMAGVGLAGLLTVAGLAEADRRRMRRARPLSEVTA